MMYDYMSDYNSKIEMPEIPKNLEIPSDLKLKSAVQERLVSQINFSCILELWDIQKNRDLNPFEIFFL